MQKPQRVAGVIIVGCSDFGWSVRALSTTLRWRI